MSNLQDSGAAGDNKSLVALPRLLKKKKKKIDQRQDAEDEDTMEEFLEYHTKLRLQCDRVWSRLPFC